MCTGAYAQAAIHVSKANGNLVDKQASCLKGKKKRPNPTKLALSFSLYEFPLSLYLNNIELHHQFPPLSLSTKHHQFPPSSTKHQQS